MPPCNTEHLEPTAEEAATQNAAYLAEQLSKRLNKPVPASIRAAAGDCYANDRSVVPYLCTLFRGMSKKQMDKLVYNGRDAFARKLADWWDEHQRDDAKRKADEARAERNEVLRKKAIAKLSAAERKALGV